MKPLDRRLRSLRNEAEAALLRHQRELALAALVGGELAADEVLEGSYRRLLAYLPVGATLWMPRGWGRRHTEWRWYRFEGFVRSQLQRGLIFVGKRPWGWEPYLFPVGTFLRELCDGNVRVERP